MGWRAFAEIDSLTTDFDNDTIEVRSKDGRVITERRLSVRGGDLMTKRVTIRPDELIMTIITRWDEPLEVEIFDPDRSVQERLGGRPIVYLDQNKWSLLADSVHRPEKVSGTEPRAAAELVRLARKKRLVLPISSGHMIETSPLYSDRRRHLASLMVGLSRGWVMRDPLLVTASELRSLFFSLRGRARAVPSTFTLDTRAFFAESREYEPQDLDLEQFRELLSAITSANSILDVLLETDRTEPEGIAESTRWAAFYQEFGRLMSDSRSRSERRRASLEATLMHLGHGLVDAARAAGMSDVDLADWAESRAEADLGALPSVGRQREVIHTRFQNRTDGWKPNDLVDLMYLSCAAGYADHIVCEKKMGTYLRQVGQRTQGAEVHICLGTLVESLGF
jgi:hypothetical protein